MKPMSLFYAGLLFVAVIVSGGGWYGNLVVDYADSLNATSSIDTSDIGHERILAQANQTQVDMESGFISGIKNIPIIGGITVRVFSTTQAIKSFMFSLWDALTIGTMLITGLTEVIPWVIHPTIMTLIQISLVMLFVSSLVYILLRRKVD